MATKGASTAATPTGAPPCVMDARSKGAVASDPSIEPAAIALPATCAVHEPTNAIGSAMTQGNRSRMITSSHTDTRRENLPRTASVEAVDLIGHVGSGGFGHRVHRVGNPSAVEAPSGGTRSVRLASVRLVCERLRPGWRWLLPVAAIGMVIFAVLDLREAIHQLNEADTGLGISALIVAGLHAAAGLIALLLLRQPSADAVRARVID